MKQKSPAKIFFYLAILLAPHIVSAQDQRIQYPPVLKNSYFGVNIGSINYKFSSRQLKAGNSVASVYVPPAAVRIILYGHQFSPYLSGQISYMRPVKWVEYRNVNGDGQTHTVWMNIAGLTLCGSLPVTTKINVNAEAGLALIMRRGFEFNGEKVVQNATYSTGEFGGSVAYKASHKWELHAGVVWSPENKSQNQPATRFFSAGFNYFMRELPKEKIEKVKTAAYHFPLQQITVGIATNALGYDVNTAVSQGAIPIFWGGEIKIKSGVTVNYQRNIFHSRKVFALDWGTGIGVWKSRQNNTSIVTVSVYPVFRFTILRSATADFYAEYSVAGPSYISTTHADGHLTGEHFTFQDVMGIGVFAGKKKNLNAGIHIAHYSNGNLFPENSGYMIPLTFSLGYAF
jgi:hypothetical protein